MRFISLCLLLLLTSCSIAPPNIKACAVAGVMSAGADCVYTLSEDRETMNLDELIVFLEPQEERVDPKNPEKKLPARGPAILIPSEDWVKLKTFIQQACKKLGNACSVSIQKKIDLAVGNVDSVSNKKSIESKSPEKKPAENSVN